MTAIALVALAAAGVTIAAVILLIVIASARADRAERHRGRAKQELRGHITSHGNDL